MESINIVYSDVDEHIHHEDVFKKDRLNKQIDINDIDINGVLHAMQKHDESLQPMNSATIRLFTSEQISFRMHLDSVANKSITPYKEILHDLRKIPTIEVEGVGGKVSVSEIGKVRIECDDESNI